MTSPCSRYQTGSLKQHIIQARIRQEIEPFDVDIMSLCHKAAHPETPCGELEIRRDHGSG